MILVAFINAAIDFYQIQKSEAILASFLAMIPPSCRVVRDGTITSMPAAELVKGDIVLLVSARRVEIGKNVAHQFIEYSAQETKLRQTLSYSLLRILRSITVV